MKRSAPISLRQRLTQSARVLLGTHEHPDADGIGSLIALGLVLRARGFNVARVPSHSIPTSVRSLPGLDGIPECAAGDVYDVGILFDCHDPSRLGSEAPLFASAKWTCCIDHHPLHGETGLDEDWVEADAPATALLVLGLIRELFGDDALDADVAHCLYGGLITDTGGFRHENTTVEALQGAAFLVERGAGASDLAERLLHRRRPEGVDLLARALGAIRYEAEGRIAYVVLDREMFLESGAAMEEAEGVVGHLTAIEGVQLAALIKPDGPTGWRVSLRSNGSCSVDGIARSFGGGGHRQAAAFTSEESLEALRSGLVLQLRRRVEECQGEH